MLDFDIAIKPKRSKKEKHAPTPAALDPFDVTPVRDALKVYEAEVAVMKQTATDHQVVDEESNKSAIEMAAQAKRLAKTIEDMRKERVRPFQEYTKSINNLAKVYTDSLEAIERSILKPKINEFLTKQKLERLEAERRAQEAARELQAKLDAESLEKNLPKVEVPVPVLPQKAEPVRTEEGSASQRKTWKWRVVELSQVPTEFMEINSVAVNQAVRAGCRVIPGIDIFEEESVQIRL